MAGGEGPTVALVHATPAAIAPAVAAFGERFPSAGLWHLLDDRPLSGDQAERLRAGAGAGRATAKEVP